MHSEFIDTRDDRWRRCLEKLPHDIYHLPSYVEIDASRVDAEPVAFLGEVEDKILFVPVLLRTLPDNVATSSDWRDAISPYGYASPLIDPDVSVTQGEFLWQSFLELCRERSVVDVFLRLHPLLALSLPDCLIDGFVHEGDTVFIDLSQNDQEIYGQTRNNHRRGIRQLEKKGYVAVIDDWDYLDVFIELYRDTMIRVGADPSYLFSSEYFYKLIELDGGIHLCTILSPDGEVAAAGLFFAHNNIVQFHLSGTAEDYLSVAPTKLMFDSMWRWSKRKGASYLHLGGGVGCRNDSLYNFKAGFSKSRAEFASLRLVCDRDKYDQLVKKSPETCFLQEDDNGYFPAYRETRL